MNLKKQVQIYIEHINDEATLKLVLKLLQAVAEAEKLQAVIFRELLIEDLRAIQNPAMIQQMNSEIDAILDNIGKGEEHEG